MTEPEEVLRNILNDLKSANDDERMQAIVEIKSLKFSSQAVRLQLEQTALHDKNRDIKREAINALDLPVSRNVQAKLSSMPKRDRDMILNEIEQWTAQKLIDDEQADVLKLRYDIQLTSTPTPAPVAPQPTQASPTVAPQPTPAPASPRPTLVQTLLSETSIKIALYLGAFFVIASAIILAAVVEAARLPVLVIGTTIFGGLALAIRKRLPQPSFALFIVFSFLLPITANVLEEIFNLSAPFSAGYWVIVSLFMALIWSGSTWLYQSRLFSVTAFISFAVSFYRIGDIFDAEIEFYFVMLGLAALIGLAGVFLLKKWKDAAFALPLFISAQVLEAAILFISISAFAVKTFDPGTSTSLLWNLAHIFAWMFAFIFYVISNLLYPFLFFPWLAAGTLIPIPWFIGAAFDLESLGAAILLLIWGVVLSGASELAHRFEATRKYSLPILLASLPTFTLAIIDGFSYETFLGLIAAMSAAFVYSLLHVLRTRGWLWAIALFSFIIAYFAFFNLEFVTNLNIFFGYPLLGLGLLFLQPDLFLKNSFNTNLAWKLPLRIYGTITVLISSLTLLEENTPTQTAICFGIYTVFFALYVLVHRKEIYGYISAAYFPLTIFYALNAFKVDAWLPTLTALAVLYFLADVAIKSKENWSRVLRNSALALGTIVSIGALLISKETGGWYALVIGLLFAAEMYLSRNGWFEIGIPVLFNIGAFLILRDLEIEEPVYHLLAYSLVWFGTDIISHIAFKDPRPLKWIVRGTGAIFTVANYGLLFFGDDSLPAAVGFGVYTLLFLTISLLYAQPTLGYAFTVTLPLFVTFFFREFDITQWIHPVIFVAVSYYALGYLLRQTKRAPQWDTTLLVSGLGLGVIVSMAAPILGGVDAALPVAIAATLWAVEAFAKKNVWLAFPANILYLLAYFIILVELKQDEPQFFSMGAALLGLIQHYLLTRAGSKRGAFLTGMVSQLVLLGTTYIQMVSNGDAGFIYFVVLFFQSIAVLFYGRVVRSRSLTFMPIIMVVLGVVTVTYSTLKGINVVVIIGCTGVVMLVFGVIAVLMRERITKLSEKLSSWQP